MAKEEPPLRYEKRDHSTKGLAQKLDVDYQTRPRRLGNMRGFMLIAPLIAAGAMVPFFFGGGPKAFSNGPISRAHAVFERNCTQCHVEKFAPVRDQTCICCHAGPAHTEQAKTGETERCGECHVEHKGSFLLADVADGHCTRCHKDIESHAQKVSLVSAEQKHVTAFRKGGHPEFTARMRGDDRPLRLNHKLHMNSLDTSNGRFEGMECRDCHAVDAAGAMQPVRFDKNCKACHNVDLEFDNTDRLMQSREEFETAPPPGIADGFSPKATAYIVRLKKWSKLAVPHNEDPVKALQIVTQAYTDLLANHPDVAAKMSAKDGIAPPAPQLWLRQSINLGSSSLFTDPNRCRKCHTIEQKDNAPTVKPVNAIHGRYAPENREGEPWLSKHNTFSHKVHRPIRCESCHTDAITSEKTAQVLIPAMQVCMDCHSGTGTAQDRCSQCHLYHEKGDKASNTPRTIQQLMNGSQSCSEGAPK